MAEERSAAATFTQAAGIVTGLAGVGLSLLTFSSALLKLLVLVVFCSAGMVMFQAARDRQRGLLSTPMIVWLSLSGACVLVLVVILAAQTPPAPAQGGATTNSTATSTPASSTPASSTSTPGSSSEPPATAGATWLDEVEPIRRHPNEPDWSSRPVQVKGQTYKRALVTTETWCGNNQQEYVLGGKYTRFTAKVGLDDHSEQPRPLNFFVIADQKLVKKVSAVGLTAIEEVDVPLTGVTRLGIGVETESGQCHRANEVIGGWIEPQLR